MVFKYADTLHWSLSIIPSASKYCCIGHQANQAVLRNFHYSAAIKLNKISQKPVLLKNSNVFHEQSLCHLFGRNRDVGCLGLFLFGFSFLLLGLDQLLVFLGLTLSPCFSLLFIFIFDKFLLLFSRCSALLAPNLLWDYLQPIIIIPPIPSHLPIHPQSLKYHQDLLTNWTQ